jgi:predicted ATP-grasp superfamily ATP-dependent carboligase
MGAWEWTPQESARRAVTIDCTILDANSRQSLVMARMLGRAGLSVALVETEDESSPIPAFHSSYVHSRAVLPSIRARSDDFGEAVLDLLVRQPTRVLVPAVDASIAALRPYRTRIEARTRLALASEASLDVANDKTRTLALAQQLGLRIPRSEIIDRPSQVADALAETGLPAVIKPAQSWVWGDTFGNRILSREVVNQAEAVAASNEMFEAGSSTVSVQEYITGRREALYVFYAHGRIWAEFALVAHRMAPVLGGYGVLRESIAVPEDLSIATARIIEATDVEGVSEVEFRRDDKGQPVLMEINARLPGTLELATRAGVNFPQYLWDWGTGAPLIPSKGDYKVGVRLRYLYGDIQWLQENIRRRGRTESIRPAKAIGMFAAEFLHHDAYDYFDTGDLLPTIVAAARTVPGSLRRAHTYGAKRCQTILSRRQLSRLPPAPSVLSPRAKL